MQCVCLSLTGEVFWHSALCLISQSLSLEVHKKSNTDNTKEFFCILLGVLTTTNRVREGSSYSLKKLNCGWNRAKLINSYVGFSYLFINLRNKHSLDFQTPEAKTLNSLTTCLNTLRLISELKKFGVRHTVVIVTWIVHVMYCSWNENEYPDFRGLFTSCLVGSILCHTALLWMVILYYWILIVETGPFEFPRQHLASVGLKWVWPTGTILENKLCMASESQITKTVPELLKNVTVKDLLVTRVIYLCVFPYRLLLFGPRDMVKPSSLSQKFRFRNQQKA